MEFSVVDNLFTISCDMVMTAALAAVVLLVGLALRKRITFLRKYCIPAPVVGGFLFMIIVCAGHVFNLFTFEFNVSLQNVFMVAFFTTVGLGADFALIKKGGKLLLIYWACAGFIAAMQGPIALLIGNLVGLENAYSLLAGAISMSGGHGAAAAYGSTFAGMGYSTAPAAGIAAATFGLITSVMIGGPLARKLIVKNNLKSTDVNINAKKKLGVNKKKNRISDTDIAKNFAVILLCMAFGMFISKQISALIGMTLPDYLGAMILSIIVRNLNEVFHFYNYSFKMCDKVGMVCLDLFLSIAMMSIKLWELVGLVGGIALIVLVQVVIMIFYVYFIVFKALGKTFDAAVMCAGMCGHALGATPTAMANMESVQSEYGTSHKAFVIVPIVAAFLVELIYQPITILLVNMFVPVVS